MIGIDVREPAVARWLAVLDSARVRFLILDVAKDRALLEAARADPAWTVDFDDGESVLLARSVPA